MKGLIAALGPNAPATLRAIAVLADLRHGEGDLATASRLYERRMHGLRAERGDNDADTLAAVHNLAHIRQQTNDYAGALPLMREVLDGSERALGAGAPSTLRHATNVAWLLQRTGDVAEAVDMYRKALAGLRGVKRGDRDKEYVNDIMNTATGLVNTLTNARRMSEAQAVIDSGVLEKEMEKYQGEYAARLNDKDVSGTGYKKRKKKGRKKKKKGPQTKEEKEQDDGIKVRTWTREEEPGMQQVDVEI